MLTDTSINKIIYFDKETICNILQERDHGTRLHTTDISSSFQNEGAAGVESSAKLKLEIPLNKTQKNSHKIKLSKVIEVL